MHGVEPKFMTQTHIYRAAGCSLFQRLHREGREVQLSNSETLRGLYEAFAKGDVPAVLGAMDPNIAWQEAEGHPYKPDGKPWVGPDAIVENLFMKLGTEWEGFTVTPARFTGEGDRVVVEGRYTGKYMATGNSVDSQFCHVWTLAGGKITAFQQYTDTGQFQKAMGV